MELSRKTAIGPDSSLKQFPLLYLYFDNFEEITKAWQKGCFEAARHDSDIRSRGFSLDEIMKNEGVFLELYRNKLLRLRLSDGTELRRDVEEDYWDRIVHPEKYSDEASFGPDTNPELIARMKELHERIDDELKAIKLRYGL
jgi:hypothetical protein